MIRSLEELVKNWWTFAMIKEYVAQRVWPANVKSMRLFCIFYKIFFSVCLLTEFFGCCCLIVGRFTLYRIEYSLLVNATNDPVHLVQIRFHSIFINRSTQWPLKMLHRISFPFSQRPTVNRRIYLWFTWTSKIVLLWPEKKSKFCVLFG